MLSKYSAMMENLFAAVLLALFGAPLFLLLRGIWLHGTVQQSESQLGLEAKLVGALALSVLIGTTIAMWHQG